ncbi:hypothetical protein SEA_GOCRAZY_34 [Arthrobacter phage GoCrazy]|uniref:Uncharacterized protein n=2 Tax=Mudcatvirus TaxID=1982088 RepID=A0AAE8XJI2_9CAUD|nr:hypothetical protein PQB82_gp36 [Arthrobacter phage Dynamite]YP_010666912.1 hypothetical protein PQB83_gp34 [Arthrobacter phage KeaneyLin]QFP95004.1 hypothetical protein SEA_NAPOLEONB_36 [Arthrobacter phage NapoleonB]QXO13533.1 hypothetical protein SEA_GOCRAZY_34 [Arthrobacter phage GoCrazy]AXH44172.1 hypothetical protein SEA_KEANEYLIN_34 [Arthrobacter phage KeaneyLin]UAW09197.1 hypothetical protein SEA_DYNAMITE_36 [Arthrobacter phage Dynamite]
MFKTMRYIKAGIKESWRKERETYPATYKQMDQVKDLIGTMGKVVPLIVISQVKRPSEKMMNRIDSLINHGNQIIEDMDALEPEYKIEREAARIRTEELKAERRARKGK